MSHDPILRLLVMASWGKSGLSSVQNQTQESLLLFDKILSTSSMEKSTITLLFTKMDLFEHKVKNQSIRDWFPDYVGPSNDSEAGRDFFVQKYLSLNRQPNRKIDVVWADVTDTTSFEPKLRKIMKTPLKARSKHVSRSEVSCDQVAVIFRAAIEGNDYAWKTEIISILRMTTHTITQVFFSEQRSP